MAGPAAAAPSRSEPVDAAIERRTAERPATREAREALEPEPTLELDAAARTLAQLAPPPSVTPPCPAPHDGSGVAAGLGPHLAAELVERAAFWGDGDRGLARLRFGHKAKGGLAGATVTLEHDGEAMRLRLEGVDDPAAAARLRERLAARGISVEE